VICFDVPKVEVLLSRIKKRGREEKKEFSLVPAVERLLATFRWC